MSAPNTPLKAGRTLRHVRTEITIMNEQIKAADHRTELADARATEWAQKCGAAKAAGREALDEQAHKFRRAKYVHDSDRGCLIEMLTEALNRLDAEKCEACEGTGGSPITGTHSTCLYGFIEPEYVVTGHEDPKESHCEECMGAGRVLS